MATDSGFFDVHLQSLDSFANELEGQLDALRKPTDRLGELAGGELPLGEFAEAYELTARHEAAAQQMYTLLAAVRQAVGFAGSVTRTVETAYRNFDQSAADRIGSAASTAPTAPAVSTSSPVTVSTTTGSATVTVTYSDPALAPQITVVEA
jgi:hypothetical protein